jgi:hypothetical protein
VLKRRMGLSPGAWRTHIMVRHLRLDKEILEKRKDVYEKSKIKNPERWNNRKTSVVSN